MAVDSAPVASGPVSAPSTAEMLKPAAPVAVTERGFVLRADHCVPVSQTSDRSILLCSPAAFVASWRCILLQ